MRIEAQSKTGKCKRRRRYPFVLKFLNLKDEYSKTDLEVALIENLTDFSLESGRIRVPLAGDKNDFGSITLGFELTSYSSIAVCAA